MHARLATATLALATLVLLAPAAGAHTAVFSSDDLIRGSIGLLNEPTVTYQQSGLDACFTENTPERTPVTVNAGALTATLKSPSGKTLSMALKAQFGRTGCITFDNAFIPTEPGQYLVDIIGAVNGSSVQWSNIKAGGNVTDQGDITFPAVGVADGLALTQQVADLQGQLTALQTRLTQLEEDAGKDNGKFAPGAPAALLMVGLAALAAVRRLR